MDEAPIPGAGRAVVKVSVVVAVYNPGSNVDELLESIDQQSLPPDQFEVIFADDDSTDGSRERLVEWAATRPHVRVLHNTPNSGWPGRPRNLGIDAATGEYLFFADNDDKLAPRALEWMYDYAVANDADVVIPKLLGIGPGRSVPRQLFRRNIPDATLGKDPILAILTPHKLVRTAMVREHGIRFPEGRVRLEDHLFIVSCYFAARRISVLADKVCYFWMRRIADGENASFAPVDPQLYYRCVEWILEVVERNTEPGPLRDKLYAHWYDGKMLSRLRGGSLLSKTPAYQESLFAELRRLSERFGLGRAQWPWLGAGARLRSHLVEHGTLAQVRLVGAAERGVTQRCRVDEVTWTADNRLSVDLHAEMVYNDGRPIRLVHDAGAVLWDVNDLVPSLDLPRIDITDLWTRARLHVMFTVRGNQDVRFVPDCSSQVMAGDVLGARARFTLDPRTLTGAEGSTVVIDLLSRMSAAGWTSERRVPVQADVEMPGPRAVIAARPYRTEGFGNLSLVLGPPGSGAEGIDSEIAVGDELAASLVGKLRVRSRLIGGSVKRRLGRLRRRS